MLSKAEKKKRFDELDNDLATARTLLMTASWKEEPYRKEFYEAHNDLVMLPLQPESSKAIRLRAYDRRMQAGHAWHPYREEVRRLEKWAEGITKEMKGLVT